MSTPLVIEGELDRTNTTASMRAELLIKQQQLMGLSGSLVTRRIVNVFDTTPALKRLRVTFDYRWESADGRPHRVCKALVDCRFDASVLNSSMVSNALGAPWHATEAESVEDVEIDFNLALEAADLIRGIGVDLDVGLAEAHINATRRAINEHRDRKNRKVDLQALGTLILNY